MPTDLAWAVADGRSQAEARMLDACTIGDGSAERVWDQTTERYVPAAGSAAYTGKCRVKSPQVVALTSDAGATEGVVTRLEVHIPADVEGVAVGDIVTVTSAAFNPGLVGRTFRVTSLFHDSQATAQRLECSEAQ
jgi:hypothetical protein